MKIMQISLKIDIANPVHVNALNVFIKAINEEPIESKPAETTEEKPAETTEEKPAKEKTTKKPAAKKTAKTTKKTDKKESSIEIADLRKLVSEKAGDHRAEIKTKLKELGASNVSSLDEEHFEEFNKFLTKLK